MPNLLATLWRSILFDNKLLYGLGRNLLKSNFRMSFDSSNLLCISG